jgi:hypothetical protein
MAHGDGTTSLVELIVWDSECLNTVCSLTGKCFVYFPDMNVFDGETGLFKSFWDGDSWADSHDLWCASSSSEAEESTFDWKTEFLGN